MSERQQTASEIRAAYKDAERALRRVGRLLRTTEAGRYMWSAEHKTAVSGICVVLDKLAYDVPDYADDIANSGIDMTSPKGGKPTSAHTRSAT